MKLLTTTEGQDEYGHSKENLDEVCSSLLGGDVEADELIETYITAVNANEQLKRLESMEITNRDVYKVTMESLADQFGYSAGSHFTTEGIGAGISKLADKIWEKIVNAFKAMSNGVKKLLGMKTDPPTNLPDRAIGVMPDYKGPLKGKKDILPSKEFLEDIDARVETAVDDKLEQKRLLVNPDGGTMWIMPHGSSYQGNPLEVLRGEVYSFQSQHGCCEVIGQGPHSVTVAESKPKMIDVTEYIDFSKRVDRLLQDTVRAMGYVAEMNGYKTGFPPIHPQYAPYIKEFAKAVAMDVKYYTKINKAVKFELRQLAEAELAVIAWEDASEERL